MNYTCVSIYIEKREREEREKQKWEKDRKGKTQVLDHEKKIERKQTE